MNTLGTTRALELVDSVVRQRALIFGSLPPQGHDIDLLLEDEDADAVAARLSAQGLVSWQNEWLVVAEGSAAVLELARSSAWRLPPDELTRLFEEAEPLPGASRLVTPAPHHVLLILARRLARRRTQLAPKQRTRIAAALAAAPAAWEVADDRAKAWAAGAALARLQALYADRTSDEPRTRLKRPKRTRVISLSGLDGAGKSSQARLLADGLDRLGFPVVVEWAPARHPDLRLLSEPVRRLLRIGRRSTATGRTNPDFRPTRYPAGVAHTWVTIQAIATAFSFWRGVAPHLGRGKVVVFDRYGLDYAVFLRYRHGSGRSFRPQLRLLKALSPRPLCSYLLDVPAETAHRRKEDQYTLEELRRQAEVYWEELELFGVRRRDGEQAPDELFAAILTEVWEALKGVPHADLERGA
jgi:thymidylate kinase